LARQARLRSDCVGSVPQRSRMASTVTYGSEEPQVAGPPAQAAGMMHSAKIRLWSRRSGGRRRGSRRAATSVRNNRRVCSETVEDHDRRFWHRWPLTWRSLHAFTVLNSPQFHVRRPGTDLARRKRGFQISSPPHQPWSGARRVASTGRRSPDLPQRTSGHSQVSTGMTGVSNSR
jgi:hypothetical protein